VIARAAGIAAVIALLSAPLVATPYQLTLLLPAFAYGIALLSRFLASSWQVVRLPRIPMRFPIPRQFSSRILVVLLFFSSLAATRFNAQTAALTCGGTQAQIRSFQAKITADEDAIRRQGAGLTARDLNDFTSVADEERDRILQESLQSAISTLLNGLLAAPERLQKPTMVAGYNLPNGIGSIGAGQANALVGKIRGQGGLKQALIPAIQQLAQMNDKRGTLEYVEQLSRVAGLLKSTAEVGAAENSIEETEAMFGLAVAIADVGDFPVAVGNAIGHGGAACVRHWYRDVVFRSRSDCLSCWRRSWFRAAHSPRTREWTKLLNRHQEARARCRAWTPDSSSSRRW